MISLYVPYSLSKTSNVIVYTVYKVSDFYLYGVIDYILYFFILVVPLILALAFFTLAERKGMASIQRRIGPNVVGY